MELKKVLHMVGGNGDNSYANNSSFQAKGILRAKTLVEEALRETYNIIRPKVLVVADLGCSSGPNTLLVTSEITETIDEHCRWLGCQPPEIQLFLNDLPNNDFNNIFLSLMHYEKQIMEEKGESFVPFYVAGLPGSVYGRLFTSSSVHFFHSSSCLHWLSQVPEGLEGVDGAKLNKGNIYVPSSSSNSIVVGLYLEQFKRDFSTFLHLRSKELIFGGRMILTIPGNLTLSIKFELLAEALNNMVLEEILEEATINSFNIPLYAPSMEEVKSIIEKEGSFDLEKDLSYNLNWDPFDDSSNDFVADNILSGQNVAKYLRAGIEPLLVHHFGEEIIDDLFSRFAKNVARYLKKEKAQSLYLNLVLKLKDDKLADCMII